MDEAKRPLLALVAILVISVSLISIYLMQHRPAPKTTMKLFDALGEVTADETAKLLEGKGRVVVVGYASESPVVMAPMESFQSAVKQHHPGISLLAAEKVKIEPMVMSGPDMIRGLSADKFLEIANKYPDADAIVSFAGPPGVQAQDWSRLSGRRPKVVAVTSLGFQVAALVQSQILQLAIVPRMAPPSSMGKQPTTARELFDRYYTVITPENAGASRY